MREVKIPSIFLAAAESLSDFSTGKTEQRLFAVPCFPWEANRIGASRAPLELKPGLWPLPYHGKPDDSVGYTQSFMRLREPGGAFPEIIARPAERMLYAAEPWELESDFAIPPVPGWCGATAPYGAVEPEEWAGRPPPDRRTQSRWWQRYV